MAGRKKTPGLDLKRFQEDVARRMQRRYPSRTDYEGSRDVPFFRLVIAAGGVAAALLDPDGDRRVDPDICRDELRRGLGRTVIWATEFAARNGWSINAIVEEAWEELRATMHREEEDADA